MTQNEKRQAARERWEAGHPPNQVLTEQVEAVTAGTLYLVATPIGNLEDISFRALRILKEAGLIVCEDTRHTARLLTHYGIATPRESHHEYNERARVPRLLDLLHGGKSIALVTDAGMPLISDPGYPLVSACCKEGIAVVPIPGPCALTAALAASGLPSDRFYFEGFLPPKAAARRRRLEELSAIDATLVFFEAPHRILGSLTDMLEVLGPRQACLARELTKIHEEFLRGGLEEILNTLGARPKIQGEMTLIVGKNPGPPEIKTRPESVREDLEAEVSKTGAARNEALKSIARRRGISRKEAYRLLFEEESRQKQVPSAVD